MANETLTAIPGIRVGHATNLAARTGCTVVLCEAGAVAGVDVRGGAPGTRETDAIRPGKLVQRAHAVLLTGGSAFGLDAAAGVMQYLEERGAGFATRHARVPIVPAAVIYDLGIGDAKVRPDKAMGYQACVDATSAPVATGCVGAGTGALVGKSPGTNASPGGIGSACVRLRGNLRVAALVVVNAVGNVVDPHTGAILTGARDERGRLVEVKRDPEKNTAGTNTTIGVVATNAALSPSACTRLAEDAHQGIARTIRPAHTLHDGDILFTLSLGKAASDEKTIRQVAVDAVSEAILNAVRQQ